MASMYSEDERDRRWALAHRVMEQESLDALLVIGEHEDSGPASFSWDTWFTNGRPGSTIVFTKVGEPIQLAPFHLFALDHAVACATQNPFWISPKNVRFGRSSDAIAQVVSELGLEKCTFGVLGLDTAPPWHVEGLMPYGTWNSLLVALPGATFRSVDDAFIPKAMMLSEEEREMVRRSARIGEDMAKAMVEKAVAGNTDADMYEAANIVAFRNCTVVPGAHLFIGPETAVSGPPQWSYRPYEPRNIQNSDAVHAELFSVVGQRHTQHQLSIAIGPVHPNLQYAADIAQRCYRAGLSVLQPGVRFSDVCTAMLEPVESSKGWVRGPQIHSLNPLWALCGITQPIADRFNQVFAPEGYPLLQAMDHFKGDLILQPGMTFALEPSCAVEKHLVTVGSTIIITEDGYEELGSFTTKLIEVPGS